MPPRAAATTIRMVGNLDNASSAGGVRMSSEQAGRRMVHIEIEPDHDQVQGKVDAGDGSWRPFWGWLELMQAIEDAGEPRSSTGEQ
jgi:hypothetical protein